MSLDLNWAICQKLSDQILAEGLFSLRNKVAITPKQVICAEAGNYLISIDGEIYYVGEAKNVASRIRQQFMAKTSTFYKTYVKAFATPRQITDFQVRHVETLFGRKEVEEFAIENAVCSLNKFQRGKRNAIESASTDSLWKQVQGQYATFIAQGEAMALSQPFKPWVDALATTCAGLYLVRAANRSDCLYIGEGSDVKLRHKTHSGRTYFSALRRHVGTDVLGFSLKERNGKAKYFSDDEDRRVTEFLCACCIACLPVSLGRYELEEHLIRKLRPELNRKDNQ